MTPALRRIATLTGLMPTAASPGLTLAQTSAQAPTSESVQVRVQTQVPQVLASLKDLAGSGVLAWQGLGKLSGLAVPAGAARRPARRG